MKVWYILLIYFIKKFVDNLLCLDFYIFYFLRVLFELLEGFNLGNIFVGDWEQAYSRKDKKKKKEEETPKKTKKSKKNDLISDVGKNKDQDKNEIKDKVAKETENKELKEKNQKDIILEPVNNNVESESKIANVEPKDEVKKVN